MSRVIVGLGSAHGDDQIGWLLVDALATEYDRVNIRAPGAELYEVLQNYEQVLVVDAADMGLQPGDYRLYENAEAKLENTSAPLSSHALDFVQYWLLLEKLNLRLPAVSLFLIQIKQCAAMQAVSPELQSKLQKYKVALEQFLDK